MFDGMTGRRGLAIAALTLLLAWLPASVAAQDASPGTVVQPMAVMELFTSQGCSSCPAADAVLAAHADRDDVLALSWHVDYWDYLGWRDTFGDPRHSARQRAYAEVLGEGVYTPQVIVNGVLQGVGHREADVAQMLRTARASQTQQGSGFVPLVVRRADAGYHVSFTADDGNRERVEDATLFLVWFDPRHVVPIARGENAGRRMVYRNTVRGMQMLGSVSQGRLEVSLSTAAMRRAMPEGKACALILQRTENGLPGPIYGAALLGALPSG